MLKKSNDLAAGRSLCDHCSGVAYIVTKEGCAYCRSCSETKQASEKAVSVKSFAVKLVSAHDPKR